MWLGLPQPQLQIQRLIRVPVRDWHWGCHYDKNYLLQGNSCQGCDNLPFHYRWNKDPFLIVTSTAEPSQNKLFLMLMWVHLHMYARLALKWWFFGQGPWQEVVCVCFCLFVCSNESPPCVSCLSFWYFLSKKMTSGSTVHFIILNLVTADLIILSLFYTSTRTASCKDIGKETLLQLITRWRREEVASNVTSSASWADFSLKLFYLRTISK